MLAPKTAHTFIIDPANRNTYRNKCKSLKYTESRSYGHNNINHKSSDSSQRLKTSEHKYSLTEVHKLNEELHENTKISNASNGLLEKEMGLSSYDRGYGSKVNQVKKNIF